MKNNIQIGEYIRTIDSEIKVVESIVLLNEDITNNICITFKGDDCGILFSKDEIKKHSKNIIDLIEEGDIINFYYSSAEDAENVMYVERVGINSKKQLGVSLGGKFIELEKLHLSSILTYEQYEKYCYNI